MNVWDIVEDPYPGMPELKWRYYAPGGCIGYCKTKKEAEASVAHLKRRYRVRGSIAWEKFNFKRDSYV